MQGGRGVAPKAFGHALDRARLQCHHRPAVSQTQWPLRGLLGTPGAQDRSMSQLTYVSYTPSLGSGSVRCKKKAAETKGRG
jgi:hypothetical protein